MREIKFRAWDKESKEMLSDVSLWNDDFTSYLNEHVEYLQDKCELMQYTGLKDKNSVKIYEGDIVDFGVTTNIKEVVFEGESASFRVYEYLYEQGSSLAEKWFLDDCSDIEVIGNIYKNPELLESK